MSYYLDTSFVIPLFVEDAHTARADVWIAANAGVLAISSWVEAEFWSVIGRNARAGGILPQFQARLQQDFDTWTSELAKRLDIVPEAGVRSALLTRNAVLKLSAPDALHLAIAMLNGLTLVTFDTRLSGAAKTLSHPALVP